MEPQPPFLIVRPKAAFWVETASHHECSALPRSECVPRGAFCYDASGGVWRIVAARPAETGGLLQKLLPWKREPVELELAERQDARLSDIIVELLEILDSGTAFSQQRSHLVPSIKGKLAAAQEPIDLIEAAFTAGTSE